MSETVSIDDPAVHGEVRVQKFGQRTLNGSRRQKRLGKLLGGDDARHHPETKSIRDFGIVQNARRNDRTVGEPSMESGSVAVL